MCPWASTTILVESLKCTPALQVQSFRQRQVENVRDLKAGWQRGGGGVKWSEELRAQGEWKGRVVECSPSVVEEEADAVLGAEVAVALDPHLGHTDMEKQR